MSVRLSYLCGRCLRSSSMRLVRLPPASCPRPFRVVPGLTPCARQATQIACDLEPMPPRYEDRAYWDDRFKAESHFEWLGDGVYTIIPHLLMFLMTHPTPPRLLNIGAGSSYLSQRALDTYRGVYGQEVDASRIVNLDYSEELVRRQVEAQAEDKSPGPRMCWVKADALNWASLSSALGSVGGEEDEDAGFNVVLDKSTSDCIACMEDITVDDAATAVPPLRPYLQATPRPDIVLNPMELLALNLACITRPGGLWIALSFSAHRFEFLQQTGIQDPSLRISLAPGKFWTLKTVDVVDAYPGGDKDGVHTPQVKHFVYIVERTEIVP